MKAFLLGLLSDSEGHSLMRVMSIVSLLIGAVIGLYGVYMGTDLVGTAAVCSVFVVSAFGGKLAQKSMEKE